MVPRHRRRRSSARPSRPMLPEYIRVAAEAGFLPADGAVGGAAPRAAHYDASPLVDAGLLAPQRSRYRARPTRRRAARSAHGRSTSCSRGCIGTSGQKEPRRMSELREVRAVRAAIQTGTGSIVLVHALAQLPDDVTLRLCGASRRRAARAAAPRHTESRTGSCSRVAPDGSADHGCVRASEAERRRRPAKGTFCSTPPEIPRGHSTGSRSANWWSAQRGNAAGSSCTTRTTRLAGARVAVITNLPAPYRLPLFEEPLPVFAQPAQRSGCSSSARVSRPAMDHADCGRRFRLPNAEERPIDRGQRPRMLPLDLELALWQFRPTIVLCGGLSPAVALRASFAARLFRASFGVWSGDHLRMPTAQAADSVRLSGGSLQDTPTSDSHTGR